MSTQAQAAAVLTAINAAISPKLAYDYDTVPSPRPDDYIEVGIIRVFGGAQRQSGQKGRTGYRILVRSISRDVFNARLMHDRAMGALEDLFLPVAGKQTPIQFETSEPIGPDDGWFSGYSSYTYTT